jgi:hypothetical protein
MTTQTTAPFTWLEIENQIRTAIMRQFDSLRQFGPDSDDLSRFFLGLDPESIDADLDHDAAKRALPVHRHGLHRIAKRAFLYAYQLDGWSTATVEDYHLSCALLVDAYAMADTDGEPSPLAKINDPPLRRVLETFVARWKLSDPRYHYGLTVRELALLSNMTVPAVRTSLSKEGFKLEANNRADAAKDENGVLSEGVALVWLSRRRGFVPTRTDAPSGSSNATTESTIMQWLDTLPFVTALDRILAATQNDAFSLAAAVDVDPAWLKGLLEGGPVALKVDSLRKLSRHLGADEATFVSKAVHHLISAEVQADAA